MSESLVPNPYPIKVIGGAYLERCLDPEMQLFRGSGARAAAFLASAGVPTTLATFLGFQTTSDFEKLSKIFGYKLECLGKRDEIIFTYIYPLSMPQTMGTSSLKANQVELPEPINAENALIFGMLEQRPPIIAQRAVYDPQNGYLAEPFNKNGSNVDELAIVASYSEANALTGLISPWKICSALMHKTNAQVVIVKYGPYGAWLGTPDNIRWIPSFPTKTVFKIGSGDIFSAAFSYIWLCLHGDPELAAMFASLACARYVQTRLDRFKQIELTSLLCEAKKALLKPNSPPSVHSDRYIYLAAPFFTLMQKWLVNDIQRAIISMGFNVFSPMHDVGLGDGTEIAQKDLAALNKSSALLAILDGLDPGTLFEVGYAIAHKIKVVVVAENIMESDLIMLKGSGCTVYNDLASAIYAACWATLDYE